MDDKDTKGTVTPPPEYKDGTAAQPEKSEIQVAPPPDYNAPKAKTDHLEDARGWESENIGQGTRAIRIQEGPF
jgi:hypothetical protein